ncbi:MAG: hypothetical protein ABIJ00_00625 [Candidatus Eisenbacteria bacterium]
MRESGRTVPMVLAAVLVVTGIAGAFVFYHFSTGTTEEREARRAAAFYHKRFVAEFDSLSRARLQPVLYRAGTFTASGFDAERKTWTVTITAADWKRRPESSKKDLAARLLTAFSGARSQAGGDAGKAEVIIKCEDNERVARCTLAGGAEILK